MCEDIPENVDPVGTVVLTRYKPAYRSGPGKLWTSYKLMLCGVVDCTSSTYSSPEMWFFRLPLHTRDSQRRQVWLTQIGRSDLQTYESLLVCEKHFDPSDIVGSSNKASKCLRSQAIPSLLLPSLKPMVACRAAKPKHVYRRINNIERNSIPKDDNACIEEPSSTNPQANIDNDSDFEPLLVHVSKTQKCMKTYKKSNSTKEYSDESKLKIFRLYYKNAVTYEVLQSTLDLPSISILPSFIPSTPTGVNEILMANLKVQATLLTPEQKYCMVCLSLTRVKPHINYNFRLDTIYGVCGRSNAGPVQYAVIAMVRGIRSYWHRVASITLLASLDTYVEYNTCLDKLIMNMTDLGIYIKAVMTSTDDFFINAFELRGVCIEKPILITNKKNVYHLFDPRHLMLLLYNMLYNKTVTYTEEFQGDKKIANWDHISRFYDVDSARNVRLTNKTSVIDPNDLQKNKLKLAAQILSMNTASGISKLIDLKILEKEALDTVNFIVRVNKIFTALYPDGVQTGYEHNQMYTQPFWQNNIQFLQSIKIHQANPEDEVKLVNCFSTSMQSILLLKNENFVKDNVASLIPYLRQDPLVDFIHTINLKKFTHKYPDLNEFFEVIKEHLMQNNMHTITRDRNNCRTEVFIEDVKKIIEQNKKVEQTIINRSLETDYIQIENFYDVHSLVNVATYLLDKMYAKYKDSVSWRMKMMNSSVYYENKQEALSGSLIIPDDHFLRCINNMDAVFVNACKKALATRNLYRELMKEMNKYVPLSFVDLGSLEYVLLLFVDLRIYYTVKYNNHLYDTEDKDNHQFVVRRLSSPGLNLDDKNNGLPKFIL